MIFNFALNVNLFKGQIILICLKAEITGTSGHCVGHTLHSKKMDSSY